MDTVSAESALSRLKAKALSLPLKPGVYLMKDKKGKVIYVGKAKQLKNRVSSYFQEGAVHHPRTRRMVARVEDFDTIITESEFEALVLECSLIKHHMPHYNVLLKDSKGYPFIRLSDEPYPSLGIVNAPSKDKASYFGPYGGRKLSWMVIESIRQTLKMPTCAKQFPRDIGKGRPCLQFHMNRCIGVCRGEHSPEDFKAIVKKAVLMLEGKMKSVLGEMEARMEEAAEALHFEAAAQLRDEIRSINALERKQIVVGGGMADTDVIGLAVGETRSGVAVLHYMDGNLIGRDTEMSENVEDEPGVLLSSFVSQYYIARKRVPNEVLLSHEIGDAALICEYFREKGQKVSFSVPKRGDKRELVLMAQTNAEEEMERITTRDEKTRKLLTDLQKLLGLPNAPYRIEAVDISNTGDSDRVGVMVCYKDGKPLKKAYRRFIIKNPEIHDDYHAMQEVLSRRFTRLIEGDKSFAEAPDLLLVDGGYAHAKMAAELIVSLGLDIPVYGMVKDERHRTRAAVGPDGNEAQIASTPALFAFIGQIQEETHRSAIEYHKKKRSEFDSVLEAIPGVGETRRNALLKAFGSVKKIRTLTAEELATAVPGSTAAAVYRYFHQDEGKKS